MESASGAQRAAGEDNIKEEEEEEDVDAHTHVDTWMGILALGNLWSTRTVSKASAQSSSLLCST